MAQGAWKDWSEGELVTEALFQDIQDSIAFIFANESTANSTLTRKVEGTQFYDTTANKLKIWNGSSAWEEVGTSPILQIVTATTTTDSGALSTTSFQDSGLSGSITPSATSSKVLVFVNQTLNAEISGGGEFNGIVNIMRDSTEIGEWFYKAGTGLVLPSIKTIAYVDSPSSSSSVTYKTQIKGSTTSDSGRVRANQQSTSGESPSSIHLIEIAG